VMQGGTTLTGLISSKSSAAISAEHELNGL
jgi:hypothetical protein